MNQPDKLETLVIIDDDDIFLMLCQRTLKRADVFKNIVTFNYASDALTFLENNKNEKIELIFLDINMPRMNGFEFLAAADESLGDQFRTNIVIMLTTSINPNDIAKSKQFCNVKGYMSKPLSDERVALAIELIKNPDKFDDQIMIDTDQAA